MNSVRARITNIVDYIKQSNPDILLLQEIKTQDISFPYEDFQSIGYNSYVFGQKSYNGVAIISKQELDNINNDFIKDDLKQSRIITAELKLKNKKPVTAPTIDGMTKFISEDVTAIMPAIKTKNLIESKAAKPSIPSIKLKAFTTTINTKTETIYDAHKGIS